MGTPPADSAHIKVPPPLIFVACLALGIAIHYHVLTIFLSPRGPLQLLGTIFCVAAVALSLSASATMRRSGTSLRPDKPTTLVVTTGPFRFTRNPLYLALCLLHAGVALLIGGLVPLVMTLALAFILQQAVILREERYLSSKFGPTYTEYCSRVRRWF